MKRGVLTTLLLSLLATPAFPTDIVLRASSIQLPRSFVCDGMRDAGRYALDVECEPGSDRPCVMRIQKAPKTLCQVEGSATTAYDTMVTAKVRVFTRVNEGAKSIQIDVIVPNEARSRFKNQSFHIPLATER